LGDLAGIEPVEALTGFGLGAALADGEGASPAPGEHCAPPGLGAFEDLGTIFLVLGVGGLSIFGDSPLIGTLLVEESGLIS
jgi:hypothetical protein